MSKLLKLVVAGILFFILPFLCAQHSAVLVFYNVENLFDTWNDPSTRDDDFSRRGKMKWDEPKYNRKLNNIYKVLAGIGGWQAPEVICLAEVENEFVLHDLIKMTPLAKQGYKSILYNSKDERGLDVAVLYRDSIFKYESSRLIPVEFPFDPAKSSRGILQVKGYISDFPLYIYVNHWPSRLGGVASTDKYRQYVAWILLKQLKKDFLLDPDAGFIVAGDFNDELTDNSLKILTDSSGTINLQHVPFNYSENVKGTLKYKGNWYCFDHFFVSGNLLNKEGTVIIDKTQANIFDADFLLKKEKSRLGVKPFRTYMGSFYAGGFSDHLPVFIRLHTN